MEVMRHQQTNNNKKLSTQPNENQTGLSDQS